MTGPNYTPCEFTDFAKAEKEANLVAGDTGLPMAVVEDFAVTRYSDELGTEIGRLFVMARRARRWVAAIRCARR